VVVEECFTGQDLRLLVIDYALVAAAIRRPARVVGDGRATVRALIETQSRRRAAATDGESRIPLDAETERCVADAGFGLDDVPPEGREITVRKAANLHTGGTIHDVTDTVHPVLARAAVDAARAIEIPVTGIDLMVKAPDQPDYVFIEANERPGLANHEPQPTAERFIDLLFPLTVPPPAQRALHNKETS
jgi:GNAT-family acetyltransferase (TIGR03103 family)